MIRPPSPAIRRRLAAWAAALLFVAIWYAALQAVMGLAFHVRPSPRAMWMDLAAHLAVGAVLFGMVSSLRRFVLAAAAAITALTLTNALKMAILGAPLMPDDFLAAGNMLLLLDGWPWVGAVLLILVPAGLLWWAVAWRRPATWASLGVVALGVGLLASFPGKASLALDRHLGNVYWNQPANYGSRGLPLHLLQEGVRTRARRSPAPTAEEVTAALARLGTAAPGGLIKASMPGRPTRNLHMIVLESFWDPMELTASGLSADPLDEGFRALWAAAGHSHALVPVFGGYTANSEFESLCGFPVEREEAFFEGRLRRTVPCLPGHLGLAGYRSFSSHPNAAAFWNRVNAYRRIGFDTYWSDRDFVRDDMNEGFLSDASLYRQVLDRLAGVIAGPTPVLNYVLTYFGHYPYPLNDRHPPVIQASEDQGPVAAYANTVYYKSRALMAFLRELRRIDPDGVVAIFGDHLPPLGDRFSGFEESGLLASDRDGFTDEMFRTLVSTPLVVIDGRRGVVPVGNIPLYRLPALLLQLLGDERPSIMALTAADPDAPQVRPLPGMHLLAGDEVTVCRDGEAQPAACEPSSSWLAAVRVLRRDLFSGRQHALHGAEAADDRTIAGGDRSAKPERVSL